jgi:hypothetical protein
MTTIIEQHGLDQLIRRMQAYPEKLKSVIFVTMDATLLTLWESVPPYPPKPSNSSYTRTGTLGRSLGSGEGGGQGSGTPSIFESKELGGFGYQGRFGTNLNYAEYVIGDDTQASQNSHWWVMKTVASRAKEKIDRLWKNLASQMAEFLERG